jgi:hypothetical protein
MSTKLREIADKKGDILSKILKINRSKSSISSHSSSSGPETRVIANIQERINNPLFELSITDYELMCGNKMVSKMMAKVLECDEKQLKKFCKYINVFKENINSSPKSIKNKMKPKISLNKLPDDLRYKIVEQYTKLFPTKYVLRSWIPFNKINPYLLSSNPNAIDLLKEIKEIEWSYLSGNPNAIELLREKIKEENNLGKEDLDRLEYLENPKKIDWEKLSANPNAIALLRENPKKIDWEKLSANPNAIEILRESPKKIDWEKLSTNPNAVELLRKTPKKIDWKGLSANPNAIEILRENPKKIDWIGLSANPNAIELLREKIKQESEMDEDNLYDLDSNKIIDWERLSENPNAIELLRENKDNIYWGYLSRNTNPKAIELLIERMIYESKLSAIELNELYMSGNTISWDRLSANPNAVELLKANQKLINWGYLSKNTNPKAIEILRGKINREGEMNKEDLEDLSWRDKIDWLELSTNPAIFEAK